MLRYSLHGAEVRAMNLKHLPCLSGFCVWSSGCGSVAEYGGTAFFWLLKVLAIAFLNVGGAGGVKAACELIAI